MEAVDLGFARSRLEALRRRLRETAGGGAALALAGVFFGVSGHSQLAFSFGFGAAAGWALAYLAYAERSVLLTSLVAQGDERVSAESAAFAEKLAGPNMRRRLARGLERAASAGRPGLHQYTWVRSERVFDIREELLRLAAAFRDLAVPVSPASAALCRRMLCEAAASPLYNPQIPEAELVRLLRLIAAGIRRPPRPVSA